MYNKFMYQSYIKGKKFIFIAVVLEKKNKFLR